MDEEQGVASAFAKFADIGLSFALAAFFGLIRYLQEFLNPQAPPAFKWVIAVAKGFTAGAVGMLTHWLLSEWRVGPNMSAFLIAVAGYGGAETIELFKEMLHDFVRRKAGSSQEPRAKD